MTQNPPKKIIFQGFTLVELLLVVSVVGILAGVTTTVLNPTRQKEKAKDAIIKANIEKLVLAINTYHSLEGKYPSRAAFTGSTSLFRSTYVSTFPTDTTYTYISNASGTTLEDANQYEVFAPKSDDSGYYIRYNSVWGKFKECSSIFQKGETWSFPLCPPTETTVPPGYDDPPIGSEY